MTNNTNTQDDNINTQDDNINTQDDNKKAWQSKAPNSFRVVIEQLFPVIEKVMTEFDISTKPNYLQSYIGTYTNGKTNPFVNFVPLADGTIHIGMGKHIFNVLEIEKLKFEIRDTFEIRETCKGYYIKNAPPSIINAIEFVSLFEKIIKGCYQSSTKS